MACENFLPSSFNPSKFVPTSGSREERGARYTERELNEFPFKIPIRCVLLTFTLDDKNIAALHCDNVPVIARFRIETLGKVRKPIRRVYLVNVTRMFRATSSIRLRRPAFIFVAVYSRLFV